MVKVILRRPGIVRSIECDNVSVSVNMPGVILQGQKAIDAIPELEKEGFKPVRQGMVVTVDASSLFCY